MNASNSDVVAPANTELATPAKSTPNPTSAIAGTASQVERDARVATHTNTAPTAASTRCAWRRSRIGPPKSTSRSMAKEPKAAKVASVGLPITFSPRANAAGITSAVRPARRSAARPRSRARSQPREITGVDQRVTARGYATLPLNLVRRGWDMLAREDRVLVLGAGFRGLTLSTTCRRRSATTSR
jgi:hypothetical protein